jgi:hypothetical protein
MIVHIAHKERIPVSLKGHAILGIYIGFKDSPHSFHGMASQSRMPEVCVKQAECLIHFPLYSLWQSFVLFDEPVSELDWHSGLGLISCA